MNYGASVAAGDIKVPNVGGLVRTGYRVLGLTPDCEILAAKC